MPGLIRIRGNFGDDGRAANWRATAERIVAQLEAEQAGHAPSAPSDTSRSARPTGGGRGHYDPNEARVPKDDPSHHGGRWTSKGGAAASAATAVTSSARGGGKVAIGAAAAPFGYLSNVAVRYHDPRVAYSLQQLANIVYNEVGGMVGEAGELWKANVSVAYIVLNRQDAGVREKFGVTIANDTLTKDEANAVGNGVPQAVGAYNLAGSAAYFALNHRSSDPTGGAQLFFVPNLSTPSKTPRPTWAAGTPTAAYGPFRHYLKGQGWEIFNFEIH